MITSTKHSFSQHIPYTTIDRPIEFLANERIIATWKILMMDGQSLYVKTFDVKIF
jgi:hypothetical protein